jgi:hypothetical protein
MKVMKKVFLGSAAGLLSIGAARAADLPAKAQPIQYVKVCNLYGAGFYYMPGTDMCLKIGGYVRAELTDNSNGNLTWGPFNNDQNNRSTNNLTFRSKGVVTADVREQTAYGVARGYVGVGLQSNDVGTTSATSATEASDTFYSNRAFVQWAGFTAGSSRSFYDFYTADALNYRSGYIPTEDTNEASGWWTWAYTANFGGGLSATLSAEERRMTQIIGQSTADGVLGGALNGTSSQGQGYGGWQVPDIIGNLRVDQAWGGAQVMAALHQVNAPYYGVAASSESNGHPADAWGWVAGAGLHINIPAFGAADYVEGEVNYSQGAGTYVSFGTARGNQVFSFSHGSLQGFGIASDCIYGGSVIGGATTGTDCLLTTAWSAVLAYEHFWTPQWHQSFSGAYLGESYGTGANAILCSLEGGGNGAGIGTASIATAGCNNNWSYWTAGSRLQWDVTGSFYIGVEALYMRLNSAQTFNGVIPASVGLGPTSTCGRGITCIVSDQSDWAFTLRMQKDFLP